MKKHTLVLGFILGLFVLLVAPSFTLADAPIEGRAGRAEVRFLEGMIDHHQMALDMAMDCLNKATSPDLKTLCQNVIDAQSIEIFKMRGWLLAWYYIEYTPMSMMSMSGDMSGMDMTMCQNMEMCPMMGDMGDMGGMMDNMMGGMGDMQMGSTTPAPDDAHQGHHPDGTAAPGSMDDMGNMGDMSGMDHSKHHPMPYHDPAMMMGMMAGFNRLHGVEYDLAWLESMIDHHDDAVHMSERLLNRVAEGEGHAELRELAQNIITAQTAEIDQMEAMITALSAS